MLNINNIIKLGFIPYKYSFRPTNDKKALCVLKKDTEKFICIKSKEKTLIFKDIIKDFKDENSYITIFRLNWDNYLALKKYINISPVKINKRVSFGVGDRTGLVTASQLRSVSNFDVFPILAQQTPIELRSLKRTYRSSLLDCIMGVLQTGYQGDFGADANNISNLEDLQEAIDADYSMYTINIVPFLQKFTLEDDNEITEKLNDTSKIIISKLSDNHFKQIYNIYDENLIYSAYVLQNAMDIVCQYYKEIKKNKDKFDFEIALNKADQTTTLSDLLYIMLYLKELNISITSFAPKFEGIFHPGCEYQGNREKLFTQFEQFSEILDKYGDVRLSMHSSDKFSIYKEFKEKTYNNYHIKTSGTSWLRVIVLTAIHDKNLFEQMFALATNNHTIKTPNYNKEHPELFINDPALSMLFHANYKIILTELLDEITRFLTDHEEDYFYLISKHIEKHLSED